MTDPTAIGDLELAALVSSRICHDVINPVAAIANGLEMLGEEPDQAMRDAAMDLIRKSAVQASAKLQFARLAFGAAGSAGAEIDLRDAEKVAREFVRGTGKHQVDWQGPAVTLPKNRPRLKIASRLAFTGPSKIWPRIEFATGTTAAVPRPTSAREAASPR